MYVPPHDKVAEYRRLAHEARTHARQISISDARRQLLETAQHLELLAEEEERRIQNSVGPSALMSTTQAPISGPGIRRPHFYFDTCDGTHLMTDDEGLELDNLEAARVEAQKALSDMARDALRGGEQRALAVTVRDAAGIPVLRVTLSMVVEFLSDQPSQ